MAPSLRTGPSACLCQAPRVELPTLPDAVLLDLDGTLTDAGPEMAVSFARALAHVGAPPLDETALRAFVGPPLEDSFAGVLGDPALVAEAVRVYRACHDQLASPLYEGVVETLHALRGAGVRLAVATSKPQGFAEQVVAGKGLQDVLGLVVGSDRAGGRVTKGDVVRRALELLGHPCAPVMVGDRSYDVLGAAEHGVPCIGALWGYGSAQELSGAGAVALARSPADLPGLLGLT